MLYGLYISVLVFARCSNTYVHNISCLYFTSYCVHPYICIYCSMYMQAPYLIHIEVAECTDTFLSPLPPKQLDVSVQSAGL